MQRWEPGSGVAGPAGPACEGLWAALSPQAFIGWTSACEGGGGTGEGGCQEYGWAWHRLHPPTAPSTQDQALLQNSKCPEMRWR